MVQQALHEHRPSKDEQFANKLQFFIALKTGDLDQVKRLVAKDHGFLHVKTEWAVASEGHYWPLGVTALHWAAGTGDKPLLMFLLSQGADVNAHDPYEMTPLHHAVLMRQSKMVRLLLAHGAELHAETKMGHTSLHLAVIRNNKELTQLLLTHHAKIDAADKKGYTPVDWAVLQQNTDLVELLVAHGAVKPAAPPRKPSPSSAPKGRRRLVPTGERTLGRVLDEMGRPIDGLPPLNEAPTQSVYRSVAETSPPILQTGIKIIDLMAPLKRGGHIGLFSPLSGVGFWVLLGELIYNRAAFHDGYTVYLGLEEGAFTATSLTQAWRAWGLSLNTHMVHLFGKPDDSLTKRHYLVETGLTIAEEFRRQGREILIVIDSKLALADGIIPYLKAHTAATPDAAITTLYHGDHTVGLEPEPLADLDTVLTLDRERALQGLYPAIDPLQSRSRLLRSELVGKPHAELVPQIQRLFRRYHGLHYQVEYRGLDSLYYLDDRQTDELIVLRARRLHRFLTQPFYGAEPYTGLPGAYVPIEDTLRGCQAILEGQYDSLPEEAFSFVGTIDQVVEKAKTRGA